MTNALFPTDDLSGRLHEIRRRISQAADRSGRDSSQITLIAVTKTHPIGAVEDLITLGVGDFGENRVQEFVSKYAQIEKNARWHFIGHLQRNKAVQVVGRADLIHSVDSARLLEELEKRASASGVTQRILLEVNIGNDPNKTSASPADLPGMIEMLERTPHLHCEGLMTVPPYSEDAEDSRPHFRRLHELQRGIPPSAHFQPMHLSMGMSGDFEVAIEEGATMIRIGSALLGERPK